MLADFEAGIAPDSAVATRPLDQVQVDLLLLCPTQQLQQLHAGHRLSQSRCLKRTGTFWCGGAVLLEYAKVPPPFTLRGQPRAAKEQRTALEVGEGTL